MNAFSRENFVTNINIDLSQLGNVSILAVAAATAVVGITEIVHRSVRLRPQVIALVVGVVTVFALQWLGVISGLSVLPSITLGIALGLSAQVLHEKGIKTLSGGRM